MESKAFVDALKTVSPYFADSNIPAWGFAMGFAHGLPRFSGVMRNPLMSLVDGACTGALCMLGSRVVAWLLPPPFKVAIPIACAASIVYRAIFGLSPKSQFVRAATLDGKKYLIGINVTTDEFKAEKEKMKQSATDLKHVQEEVHVQDLPKEEKKEELSKDD